MFENPEKFDAREWLKPAREAAKQLCKQRYIEFGCEGQAAKHQGGDHGLTGGSRAIRPRRAGASRCSNLALATVAHCVHGHPLPR